MSSNFVIAFGGTGARSVEAISHLMAAGALDANCRILLVDLDENNWNVQRAVGQLQWYSGVRAQLVSGPALNPFFSPSVLGSGTVDPFFWKYKETTRWGEALGYEREWRDRGDGSAINGLYELLYDEPDLEKDDFDLGYVGKAHIGALHMHTIIRDAIKDKDSVIRMFLDEIRNAANVDARLLVIGSVFGGTGASGLPAIPSIFDDIPELKDIRSKVTLGAMLIAPYFVFPSSQTRADGPDSVIHPLTAQAALFHYTSGITGYDHVYVIGAPQVVKTNPEHHEAGQKQSNKPHYVEIAVALAAAHCFEPGAQERRTARFYGCNTESVTNWEFPFAKNVNLGQRVKEFTAFALFHALLIDPELEDTFADHAWREKIGLRRDSEGYQDLTRFTRRYLLWVRALVELREQVPKGSDIGQESVTLFSPKLIEHLSRVPDPHEDSQGRCASLIDMAVLGMVFPGQDPLGEGKRLWEGVVQEQLGRVNIGQLQSTTPVGRYLELMTTAIRKTLEQPTAPA